MPYNMQVRYFSPIWTPKPLSCLRIAAGYRLTLGQSSFKRDLAGDWERVYERHTPQQL